MTLTIKRKISADTAIELTVDGSDQAEMLLAVSWVSDLDIRCGICGSADIGLRTRQVKGYKYAEQDCRHCKAVRSLGQYQSPKGVLFAKEGWKPAYSGCDNGGQE